ncbi:hypothetical protein LTR91_019386 [Friedmanniomyces endolithicus]|uniref:RING-type domain-containing protein n=2 Tax=Friedmanniomyces endolithicus TaxID=329885 RepID=A0AAN6K484_9PEZI|nr:hypothetical protein LTS09_007498 [Friedmanniomyces endolithicus]KAK0775273.1 hypothetical protein LTR59_014575 [Friedmanniomyces endolithicus]KAK0794436.1 hypothetical protein LTR38_009197 [Friedmanniomyces endolithicus]KAK0840437.1 hypothetical protein LTR03_010555 [Friedmanniomyces endolithicus]KAK0856582.1 hypothetical protein LTS02_010570 [Friedmanniomyces endolithicus]
MAETGAETGAGTAFSATRMGYLQAQFAKETHSIELLEAELVIARAEVVRCIVPPYGPMKIVKPQRLTPGSQQSHKVVPKELSTQANNEQASEITTHINAAIASLRAGQKALQVDFDQHLIESQARASEEDLCGEAWFDSAILISMSTYAEVALDMEKDGSGHTKCSHCRQYVIQFGVGPCNHRVCYECVLRRQTFHREESCLVCEEHMPFMVFIDDCTKFQSRYAPEYIMRQDDDLRIFSTTQGSLIAAMTLLRFACPKNCPYERCKGWEDLHRHLLIEHNRFMCKHCASTKGLLVREHTAYTAQELRLHLQAAHSEQAYVLEQHSEILAHPAADLRSSSIKTARYLASWEQSDYTYPDGVMRPRTPTTNDHASRIYQPDFLLQFRWVCNHKPTSDWDQQLAGLKQKYRPSIEEENAIAVRKRDKRAARAVKKVALRREKQIEAARDARAKKSVDRAGWQTKHRWF